jgi:DNA-binding SARP family transcriptional activator/tetratricopeptide (TPR) repeat protein
MGDLEYRILGPVEVWLDGRKVRIDAPRQRAVLAALLLEANRVVPVDRLIDRIWADAPPARARNTVQSLVLRLRRILGPAAGLLTRPPGYLLQVPAGRLDLEVFEQRAASGRAALVAGDAESAARELRAALALWRGEPLTGVAGTGLVDVEGPRLRERRLLVTEELIDADLECGRHADSVGQLTALVAENPLREKMHGQLMLALHRSSRRGEALEVFRTLRGQLVDELAIEPGEQVQRLHREILADERTRDIERLPRQLPPDVNDFTGRGPVRARVRELLSGSSDPGVAISGPAGVGKTALAVHIGYELAAEFTEGQVFVDLHGLDPHPVPTTVALAQILRALGVQPAGIPDSADERAAVYRGILAERRVLVLLDNVAGEAQVRPLLPGGGGLGRVMVTSRRVLAALTGSLPLLALDPLTHSESVTLLTRMLGEKRVLGQGAAAGRLVIQCGYLPLALRIAGARLATEPRWSVSTMVNRLVGARRRLDELSVGDLEVRASVGLSVAGLTEPQRQAFARLGSLWCADFAGWLAAAALRAPVAVAQRVLERLVEAQLVAALGPDAAGQERYRIHDLIRDYAREQSTGDTQHALDACRDAVRHAAARMLGTDEGAEMADLNRALPWFEAERPTLTQAVLHASHGAMPEHAWQIAHSCAIFFEVRGDWDDWERTHLAALAVKPSDDPGAEAALRCGLSQLSLDKGLTTKAREHAELAVVLGRAAGEADLEADALGSLGYADWMDARLPEAIVNFEAGLRAASQAGYRVGEIRCLLGLGHVYRDTGRYPDAIMVLGQAAAVCHKGADPSKEPYILALLGATHRDCGRLDDAAEFFRRAIAAATALGDTRCRVDAMRNLADTHRLIGDPAEALRLMREALEIVRRLGEQVGEAQTLRRLGEALSDLGQCAEAIRSLRLAHDLIRPIGLPRVQAEILYGLGKAQLQAGDRPGATAALTESIALFEACALPAQKTNAERLLADIQNGH